MATLTPNIGLKKPAGSEYPKISDAVNDNADILDSNIAKLQEGVAIIVDGDTATVAVPVGGYAYIKNNEHELPDGLYKNTSSSVFPVSGGTANSTVFTAVPTGAVNDAVSALNSKLAQTGTVTLVYVSGEYTDGLYDQDIHWMRSGNIVIVAGEFKLSGAPGSGHSYAIFSGLPFPVRVGYTIGCARISNIGKLTSGIRTSKGTNRIIIYFDLADNTYPEAGYTYEFTIAYYTD